MPGPSAPLPEAPPLEGESSPEPADAPGVAVAPPLVVGGAPLARQDGRSGWGFRHAFPASAHAIATISESNTAMKARDLERIPQIYGISAVLANFGGGASQVRAHVAD